MSAVATHLYQIAYSAASLAAIEPGYRVLDNLANPQPDWYEYGPIRHFLQTEVLDEAAYYGFFSPKFQAKTGLRHADVVREVQAATTVLASKAAADVVLFSPFPNQIAFFQNVFEQGEFFHPGLMQASLEWLAQIGQPLPLPQLVMDSRQMVYSNYFVARPAFWREWLLWNEALYAVCEGEASSLRAQLLAPTSYEGGTQRKIFVMERTASLLLTVQPQWHSHAHNPFTQGWPTEALQRDPSQAICCDALKQAFRNQGYPQYLQAFGKLRQQVLGIKK